MIFPYRIDTLFKHSPYANWVIIGLTVLGFFLLTGGVFSDDALGAMVLDGWGPTGLIGHVLLHVGTRWPHESRALATLLRMVEEDFAGMRRVGFVNEELAALRDEERLAAFFRNVGG